MSPGPRHGVLAVVVAAVFLAAVAGPADAAFPGRNGRIAAVSNGPSVNDASAPVHTMAPSGRSLRFADYGADELAFAPDGRSLLVGRFQCRQEPPPFQDASDCSFRAI